MLESDVCQQSFNLVNVLSKMRCLFYAEHDDNDHDHQSHADNNPTTSSSSTVQQYGNACNSCRSNNNEENGFIDDIDFNCYD